MSQQQPIDPAQTKYVNGVGGTQAIYCDRSGKPVYVQTTILHKANGLRQS